MTRTTPILTAMATSFAAHAAIAKGIRRRMDCFHAQHALRRLPIAAVDQRFQAFNFRHAFMRYNQDFGARVQRKCAIGSSPVGVHRHHRPEIFDEEIFDDSVLV